ncbi:MBL fold metallo-hydrolase [Oscillibacter sp.]|uniref:MBL fold metallo-hydrolase n=1 Tax=Oscillibacter sp. TaxID=1945593 RepID=UPI002603AB02|nr:MBL fold metallo-hydrolase [Oscillibacter sp.]MDD3347788.1 MBL fold metallo-hydrolase [Oscillibacter sp.]
MAEQLASGLWRLEIPLVGNPLKNLNSYLLCGERSLLIDTGFRQQPCREAMERELRSTGVDRDRMDIFLTHLHSDHTGLAPELVRENCRVFISGVDGRRMAAENEEGWRAIYDGYVQEGFSPAEMAALWETNPAKIAGPAPYDRYTYLEDGDEVTYGGRTLRCLLTPGHTPGHLCLYEPKERWLFSGDHVLFHITPNICRWSGVADSLGDYLESLRRLRSLPVSLLLPAHRMETGNAAQRAEELERHHALRLENAVDTVTLHPGLTAYEIAGHMAWSIRCRSWGEFPLTQKFFAVGEALAHLDYLTVRNRVERRWDGACFRYFASGSIEG